MRIHSLTVEQALASLNSSAAGLSASEAARRLTEFGSNHIEEVEREHVLISLAREFTHFFAIILWIGAALAIVGVIIINGIFSFWQEHKAERAVAALRQLLPQKATALRAGEIVDILASELVPGDILLLEEGDFVPADCRLIEVFGLRVNLSTVTGESLAKARNVEPGVEESPLQAKHIVLAGTSVVSGQARGVVYATGMRTEFGRIAHLTQTAGKTTSPLQREIARLSRIVACLATSVGMTLFFGGQAMRLPSWENGLFAIGIIVTLVPEGLLPTVTLSLALAEQRMARRNALVRHLPAVEALGSTTVICSDKTGTLTQNRMSVQQVCLEGAFLPSTDLAKDSQLAQDHRELFANAVLCHNLKEVDEQGRHTLDGDPMDVALAAIGRQMAGDRGRFTRVDEIPFDTDRKRMAVLCETPHGRLPYCKGALEAVLATCRFIHFDAGVAPLDPAARTRLLAAQDEMASAGLRVIAFTHRIVNEEGLPGRRTGHDPHRADRTRRPAARRGTGSRRTLYCGGHPDHHGYRRPPAHGTGHRPRDPHGQERAADRDQWRTTTPDVPDATSVGPRRTGDSFRSRRCRARDACR